MLFHLSSLQKCSRSYSQHGGLAVYNSALENLLGTSSRHLLLCARSRQWGHHLDPESLGCHRKVSL